MNTYKIAVLAGDGIGTEVMEQALRVLDAREKIGKIAVGHSAITPAFRLDAQYVIHTVGPVWRGGTCEEEKQLRSCYAPLVLENDETVLPIVKAADKLSAYIKCVEELKTGNTEFESAAVQTLDAMKAMDMPELNWFIAECLPAFSLNLDQL